MHTAAIKIWMTVALYAIIQRMRQYVLYIQSQFTIKNMFMDIFSWYGMCSVDTLRMRQCKRCLIYGSIFYCRKLLDRRQQWRCFSDWDLIIFFYRFFWFVFLHSLWFSGIFPSNFLCRHANIQTHIHTNFKLPSHFHSLVHSRITFRKESFLTSHWNNCIKKIDLKCFSQKDAECPCN